MPIRVDEQKFEECGRVAGAAIAAYTMRAMEKWRRTLTDYDCVMIMISVIAIGTARLARGEFPPAYRSLSVPIDPALLGKVNISGIAHATGLNRETARRKVNDLIELNMLVRHADGGIGLSPGLMQEERVREQVRGQLAEIAVGRRATGADRRDHSRLSRLPPGTAAVPICTICALQHLPKVEPTFR